MRLGMDGHPLMGQRTGIGRYQLNLIDQFFLGAANELESLDLLVPLGWRSHGKQRKELQRFVAARYAGRPVQIRGIAIPSQLLQLLWRTMSRPAVDSWLPGIDLFHGTNFWLPPVLHARGVITVHDLGFLVHPELHSPAQRAIHGKLGRSLGRCARIIAVSENTKRDLLKYYPYPSDRIRVVPLAADPVFRPIRDPAILSEAKGRLALPTVFVLSVCTLEPRKNLIGLIRAFHHAIPRLPHDCKLVLAGGLSWGTGELRETLRQLRLDSRVVMTGFLTDVDLVALYNLTACLVYPSRYEGFGLPVVEAMACGAPVVCSNSSSLPEVAGDAAVLVPPEDITGLSQAIESFVNDPSKRNEFASHGMARAAAFSWSRTASDTISVYREAAAEQA